MKLKSLAAMTSILFVISLFVYTNENKRGTDLMSGSEFINGIDVNIIQKIGLKYKNNPEVKFTREGNGFVLESHKSYPASSEKLN